MAADQDRRLALAADVSRLLAHPEVQSYFPARLQSGKRHVLVALSTDTYGSLAARLRSFKGPVNVAIGGKKDEVDVIVFHRSPTHASPCPRDDCEVGETSELGLLVALLKRTRKPTRIQIASPRFDAELVDNDDEVFAGL